MTAKQMQPVAPKPPMNPIDLRTDLESVEAQLKRATTLDEVRRLNARKRTIEAKLRKVAKRELRDNQGLGVKPRQAGPSKQRAQP